MHERLIQWNIIMHLVLWLVHITQKHCVHEPRYITTPTITWPTLIATFNYYKQKETMFMNLKLFSGDDELPTLYQK